MYSLETYIMTDDYYLTNLDIWILALHYNLPIVFISSTKLLENVSKLSAKDTLPPLYKLPI